MRRFLLSTLILAFLTSPFTAQADTSPSDGAVVETKWEDLLPEGFRPEQILEKYADELTRLQDGDPESMALFDKIQGELNNAPMNSDMNGKTIKLPGFIAPLDTEGDTITEFLFVPYFGACIHSPPPPTNQTIHVTTDEKNGIKPDDAFFPFWLTGKLTTEATQTGIGDAGYQVLGAKMLPYEM